MDGRLNYLRLLHDHGRMGRAVDIVGVIAVANVRIPPTVTSIITKARNVRKMPVVAAVRPVSAVRSKMAVVAVVTAVSPMAAPIMAVADADM